MDYKQKYLKYKTKYLELKQMGGKLPFIFGRLSTEQRKELGEDYYKAVKKIKNLEYNSRLHEKLKKMLLDNGITTDLGIHLFKLYMLDDDSIRSQYIVLTKAMNDSTNENDMLSNLEKRNKLINDKIYGGTI